MGKDSGSAPTAPDPSKIIPVQAAADKNAFNYQTDANRYNTVGPDQSQTWAKSSVVDQSGYDNALKAWQATQSNGTWIPGTDASPGTPGNPETGNGGTGATAATPGHWQAGTADGSAAPNLSDYTTNKYNLTTQLTPAAQALHDAQQGTQTTQQQIASSLLNKAAPTLGSAFDTSSAPALSSGASLTPGAITTNAGISGLQSQYAGLDPTQYNKNAADAVYNAQTQYLDPQVKQQQQALEARLGEQGFVPGTPGYNQAMQNFQDTNARAYSAARDSATTQGAAVGHTQFGDASSNITNQIAAALQGAQFGNQAQAQDFGQQVQTGTFNNAARGQSIAELLQQRQVPLSDLNTILSSLGGGGGGATNAGSAAVPQGGVGALQNPDQLSAYNQQYNDLLGQYNSQVSSNNNTTSTIGGLVGAIAIAF